jgi:hypothetical protein
MPQSWPPSRIVFGKHRQRLGRRSRTRSVNPPARRAVLFRPDRPTASRRPPRLTSRSFPEPLRKNLASTVRFRAWLGYSIVSGQDAQTLTNRPLNAVVIGHRKPCMFLVPGHPTIAVLRQGNGDRDDPLRLRQVFAPGLRAGLSIPSAGEFESLDSHDGRTMTVRHVRSFGTTP